MLSTRDVMLWHWCLVGLWCSALVAAGADEEGSCLAGSGPDGCAKGGGENVSSISSCLAMGFDPKQLGCATCDTLKKRLEEAGGISLGIFDECKSCCHQGAPKERFDVARLMADASAQDRDQDLHDFIKRKAPLYPGLEVEYMDGASIAIELENEDDPMRIVRADVTGWKSDDIGKFLGERLKSNASGADGDGAGVAGAWTAEIQSCSG